MIAGLFDVSGRMDTSIRRLSRRAVSILLVSLVVPLYSQEPAAWKDPSPHITRFVSVDKNVRLEVLDWGGSGMPLVLLAGGGDTAHVFDEFAPKLTASFHVYGITRRGFGASGFAAPENPADRLGDDVLAVLDTLKLNRAVLVGHSLGGAELSSMGTRHPDRVVGLVYLDAMYPYAFDNGKGPTMKEFLDINGGPQPPPPGESDLASFNALQHYYLRVLGFTFPEGELRQRWTSTPDGRVGKERDFPGGAILYAIITTGMKKYTDIPAPALAIFGNPHGLGTWVDKSTDPKVREAAKAYSAALGALIDRQERAVENGVPTVRVVNLSGAHHYVYLSNEADVLREMRAFRSGIRGRNAAKK
jgi:pimeloyl-ACP methyl ester carboxylesterase